MESGGTVILGPILFSLSVCALWGRTQKPIVVQYPSDENKQTDSTLGSLIGNTPLVKLEKLSRVTGCDIYVKMESLNPSGTGKDRAVQYMLRQAKLHPNYGPGVRIVEGTSGSTGIALAFQCNALQVSGSAENSGKARLKLHIVMPDDQADEKKALLEKLGAQVLVTPCCSISNKDHYVNRARRLAQELDAQGHWTEEEQGAGTERSAGIALRRRRVGGAIFMDQFENEANFQAHYCGTGPELWRQMGRLSAGNSSSGAGAARPQRRMDAFVMSAGTGGTIAGVSRYLKEQDPSIRVMLADPTGSSLLRKVTHGVCYTPQQSERTVRKHRYDSVVEGVGLDRVTRNFQQGLGAVDGGFLVPDQEVVDTAHWLLRNEGLFVGSSSALNVAAAVRTAHALESQRPAGDTAPVRVVTVICDSGSRHMSRLWNPEYLKANYQLSWPAVDCVPACLQLFKGGGAEV